MNSEPKFKVLLVGSETQAMQQLISSRDFVVMAVPDAEAARAAWQRQVFPLCLIGWQAGGPDLCREFRNLEQQPSYILLLVPDRLPCFQQAIRDGADDYLGQGWSADLLAVRLAAAERQIRLASQYELERQHLQHALVELSHWEQQRIGQTLHDSVGPNLAAIRYTISVLRSKLAKRARGAEELQQLENLANQTTTQIRSLSQMLYPPELNQGNLKTALANLTAQVENTFNITCRLEIQDDILAQLPEATAMHIYRIVQEAIHNAVKHGQARLIVVSFLAAHATLSFRIQDDGQGLPVPPWPEGLGLKNMQYRAQAIGAALTIEPLPGGGTVVAVSGLARPEIR